MAVSVVCPGCARKLQVKNELAGKRVKCPGCGQALAIPAQEADSEPLATRRQTQPRASSSSWPWVLAAGFAVVAAVMCGLWITGRGESQPAPTAADTDGGKSAAEASALRGQVATIRDELDKVRAEAADQREKARLLESELAKARSDRDEARASAGKPDPKAEQPDKKAPPVIVQPVLAKKVVGLADKELHAISAGQKISVLAISPDGRFVVGGGSASGVMPSSAFTWDLKTGKQLQEFPGHMLFVQTVAISPDGKTLATGSWDGTVRLWDADSGKFHKAFHMRPTYVTGVAFSPDGAFIAAGSYIGTFKEPTVVKVWEVATDRSVHTLEGLDFFFDALVYSENGLFASDKTKLIQWKLPQTQAVKSVALEPVCGGLAHHLCLSPDGGRMAAYVANIGFLVIDLTTEKPAVLFTIPAVHENNLKKCAVAFAPDGKTLAVGDPTGAVRIWDIATKKELSSTKAHPGGITRMVFSRDGTRLVTCLEGETGSTIKIWECRQE